MDTTSWTANGIRARSGGYLLSLQTPELVKLARGERLDPGVLAELQRKHKRATAPNLGVQNGVDVKDLAQAGWGVVFRAVEPGSLEERAQEAIVEHLRPLLELRRSQAGKVNERLYQEYRGVRGIGHDEDYLAFLARHGAGPGPANPEQVPFYLLLVDSPEHIPFDVQVSLSVQRAVGRIHFDRPEDYGHYANSVVAAERGGLALPRRAVFFAPENPDDAVTLASSRHLVEPLASAMKGCAPESTWIVERHVAGAATKDQLGRILGGDSPPAFLFTASHGAAFPFGDALQRSHQGALICQDWPGPQAWRDRGLDERFYFRGDDLSPDANLLGTIAFLFACYGAGTPRVDQVSARVPGQVEMAAAAAFVSALPKAMLSLSRGAALAVIGHVDLAFGCSFQWPGMGKDGSSSQIVAFESALRGLMGGLPVGAAMDYFDLRYAELAVELGRQRDRADSGLPYDPEMLGLLWTASSDARDTILLGDPAVRLAVSETGQTRTRDTVTVPSIRSEPPVAVVAPLPAVGPDVDTGSLTLGLLDRKDGESKSTELWQIHSQLVQQAQESRAQRMSCDQDPSGILWPAPGYAGGATPSPSPLRGCVRETWPSTASGRGAWSTAHSSNPEIHGAPPWPATSSRTPSRPSETASRQVKDISTLTVETRIKELGSADAPTLAARPVIKLDGDNGSDLPMVKDAEGKLVVDQALVDHHMQKMEAAIAWRAKMLESLIGLLRGQVSASHPTGSPNTLIKR